MVSIFLQSNRVSTDVSAVHIDYDLETAGGNSIIPALARSLGLDQGDLYPGWARRAK